MHGLRPVSTLLILALLAAGCTSPSATPVADPALDRLERWMTGSFSSRAQAASNPAFREIDLHMVPIWVDRRDAGSDDRWLYVEQALSSRPEAPYRQRVYRLAPGPAGTIRSEVYLLPEPANEYAGAWRFAQPLNDLTPADLDLRDGCTVFLLAKGSGEFVGSTDGEGCASTLSGATYATSEVEITADLIQSWDRGFDASGAQVWGATEGAYTFRRDPALNQREK